MLTAHAVASVPAAAVGRAVADVLAVALWCGVAYGAAWLSW